MAGAETGGGNVGSVDTSLSFPAWHMGTDEKSSAATTRSSSKEESAGIFFCRGARRQRRRRRLSTRRRRFRERCIEASSVRRSGGPVAESTTTSVSEPAVLRRYSVGQSTCCCDRVIIFDLHQQESAQKARALIELFTHAKSPIQVGSSASTGVPITRFFVAVESVDRSSSLFVRWKVGARDSPDF